MKSLLSRGNSKGSILLAAIWVAVILSGILALAAIVGGNPGLLVFSGIHSLAVRLGLVYTAVHVFRHREQIMSRIGIIIGRNKQAEEMGIGSQSPKGNRAVKIVTATAFHIVLHIISIHLAVVYTIFHIVQHRHEIFSLFKKLAFITRPTRTIQAAQPAI